MKNSAGQAKKLFKKEETPEKLVSMMSTFGQRLLPKPWVTASLASFVLRWIYPSQSGQMHITECKRNYVKMHRKYYERCSQTTFRYH